MSSSPEQPPRTVGRNSSAAHEDATIPPQAAADIPTAAYVPSPEAKGKLPTTLPASFGRYQLRRLLGQGGMGAVYLAHDTQLDRPVALKIPLFSAEEGSQVLARFYREARAAATILHANVCPVYDVGEVDGVPFLTMAYIEGKSLAEWIRTKPLTPRQSAGLVRKLALALQVAHKKGVIHRDLKPANIMIDKHGEPVIMDFGLARRNRPGDARLTQKGTVMGTPAYMPPEQVSGNPDAMGPACDIYSLGVILYELVSGRLPFSGDPMAVLSQVLLDEPPKPSQFRPELDATLERICLKTMAKKIEERYVSMAQLATALQEHLRGVSAPTPVSKTAIVKPAEKAAEEATDWHTIAQPESSQIITAERKPVRRSMPQRQRSLWVWIGGAAAGVLLLSGTLVISLWPKTQDTTIHSPPHATVHPVVPMSQPKKTPPAPPPPITPPPRPPEPPADGFVTLFNGKDLSGWEAATGDPTVWRVEDGTMFFNLTDPPRQRGWFVTHRDYTDFLLRLEFQLAPGANSGVGLRMWPGAPKPLEIQIQDDSFPGFAAQGEKERTGALFAVAGGPGTGVGLRALGEWNQMEIELRGWSLRVTVNGKATLETRLNDEGVFRYLEGAPPAGGRIGLQHWLGSVRFRNVRIKDLSGAENAATKKEKP